MKEKRKKWSFETFEHPRFLGDSWMWWREFLDGKSDSTRRNYIKELTDFMEWGDYTTESLFEEHRDNSRADDPRSKKILGAKVYKYMKHLIEGGKSTGTANNAGKTIKSFFKANELEFNINGKIKVVTDGIPNIQKSELRQILDVCGSVRMKAAIHVAKEGGMRVGDLCNIKVADISDALIGNMDFYTWTLTQEKTGRKADPVLGAEALRWLRLWMRQRDVDGIQSLWLFCLVENYGGNRRIGQKVTADTLGQLFRHYVRKAGLEDTGVSFHSLRKYNKTNLEYSGCPTSWVNKMQGRAGQGTGGIYTRPNPKQLIDMFQRGYDEIRIEGYTSRDDEIQDMRTELEDLRTIVKGLEQYRDLGTGMEPTEELLRGIVAMRKAEADGASYEELERMGRKLREKTEEA